jgi:glyoxylase-like metal-dependent hydrolase (beta-lactamase superfamily II)
MDVQFGRVRFICGDSGGKYPFNHSVFLEGRDCRVLIDPSCGLQKLSGLKEKDGVDQVWLSHWHEDHMGFLYLFDQCPLRISEKDFPPLTDVEIFLDWYNIKDKQFRDLWKKIVLNDSIIVRKRMLCFFRMKKQLILDLLMFRSLPHPVTHRASFLFHS